jgi:uncharacterized protein
MRLPCNRPALDVRAAARALNQAGLRFAFGLVVMALSGTGPSSAQAPPVPPPVEQQIADCRNPVFATDHLVCGDTSLLALDSELAEALAATTEPESRWIEPQRQWFSRRSRCAFSENHRDCAIAAYRERIALLRPINPSAKMSPTRCDDPLIKAVAISPDWTVLLGQEGNILGVAQDVPAAAGWEPFLTIVRSGERLVVHSADGSDLKCRIRLRANF